MKKKNAFTLIELLVVIAIMGILIAILMPAISKALESSRRSTCANNLKGIGTGFLVYASDNQGDLPPGDDLTSIAQAAYNSGVVSNLNIWVCPSDKNVSVAENIDDFDSGPNCSYMYVSGYTNLVRVQSLASTPLLMDEVDGTSLADTDNHGKSMIMNVVFFDGHVTAYKGVDADKVLEDISINNPLWK